MPTFYFIFLGVLCLQGKRRSEGGTVGVGGLSRLVVVPETSGAEFIGLMGVWAGGDLRMDESILKDDNGEMQIQSTGSW